MTNMIQWRRDLETNAACEFDMKSETIFLWRFSSSVAS